MSDQTIAASSVIEARIQEIRVNGVVARAAGSDPRFASADAARNFINELELKDQDKPLPWAEDLRILEEAGLVHASMFWMEYREAVTGGVKS